MLCYRCGSHTPDGSRQCEVCGEPFSDRRITGGIPRVSATGSGPIGVAPYEVGDIIAERYRVKELLAKGAAGWVLQARDEEVETDVAVKIVSGNLLQTHEDRDLFAKAVKRARKLHHQNIVRIYDEGTDNGLYFYTMPLLEGLSLRKIMALRAGKGQVFAPSETMALVHQIGMAIDAIAKTGVHGSIRPSNILVLPDILKLTGLPHFTGLPHRPFIAQQADNIHYLAPEARHSNTPKTVKSRADVYTLAVIAGEMLSGRVLGRDIEAWPDAESLSPALSRVLHRATSPEAGKRFSSGKLLCTALNEAADIEEGEAAAHPLNASPPERSGQQPTHDITLDSSDFELEDSGTAHLGLPERKSRNNSPFVSARPSSGLGRGTAPSSGIVLLAVGIVLAALGVSALMLMSRDTDEKTAEETMSTQTPGHEDTASAEHTAIQNDELSAEAHPTPHTPERSGKKEPAQTRAVAATKSTHTARTTSAPKTPAKPATQIHPKSTAQVPPPSAPPQPQAPSHPKPPPPPPPRVTPAPEKSTTLALKTTPSRAQAGCPHDMIEIKKGSFNMGSQANDKMRGFGDLPWRTKSTRSYCVDMYEYPNQKGTRPTVNISWSKANSLCKQRGKRLCSETEWERACKGPRNLRFPTGNRSASSCNAGGGHLSAAGSFARCKSAYGIADMAGNAAEWTSSRWSPEIPDIVVKGGTADQAAYTARCAARSNQGSNSRAPLLGLRCCKSL